MPRTVRKGADASAKIPSPGGLGSLISGGLGGLGTIVTALVGMVLKANKA